MKPYKELNHEFHMLKIENEILSNINRELTKQISELRTQTAPKEEKTQYPIHWGGYAPEESWETACADLALRVVKLEKELNLVNNYFPQHYDDAFYQDAYKNSSNKHTNLGEPFNENKI
jgi:hypothetical protein